MSSRALRVGTLALVMGSSANLCAQETVQSGPVRSRIETSDTAVSRLSPVEQVRARQWDLSAVEWERYRSLMDGIRGSISPTSISPIEVLGIHARDDAERRRYAEAWARAMRKDVDRVLAFQRAYDAAGRRLFPKERLIDPARLPRSREQADALGPEDRVLLFTRPDCAACDELLGRLLARRNDIEGIDIYIAGIAPGDDAAVRDWAAAHGISPEWVRRRQVTLNHDAGALERVTDQAVARPYLMRRRGDGLAALEASALAR